MRILIADDHEVIRRTVARIFQVRGDIESAEAVNGKEAVEKARDWKPDLILLDVRMPERGGFEAAEQIKEHSPNIPILFFSIHDTSEILDEAKLRGEGVILKDEVGKTLLKAVDALLQGQTFFPS